MTASHMLAPARLLGQALSDASPDPMRDLLTTVINALLSTEADAVCGAEVAHRLLLPDWPPTWTPRSRRSGPDLRSPGGWK